MKVEKRDEQVLKRKLTVILPVHEKKNLVFIFVLTRDLLCLC